MQRTDRTAADVAWARPATIPADLILNYSGPAFAGVEQIRAWGKPYLLGFESITTRAYAGYDAGIADAQQLVSVARTIPGYLEGRCGFWFCAADENSTPSWALPGITAYARAFRAVCGPVKLLAYGNRAAVVAAIAGGADLGWGVGTWGYGEGGGPNLPPGDSDAALVQSGNTPGPADGTDLNWLYRPLDVFAAWGGPAAEVLASPLEEDEMYPRIVTYVGAPAWWFTWIHPLLGTRVKRPIDNAEVGHWKAEGAYVIPNLMQQSGDPWVWDKGMVDSFPAAPALPSGGGGDAPRRFTGSVDLHAA